jgi:hypothetical protein
MTDAKLLYADLKCGFLLSLAACDIAACAVTSAFASSFIYVPFIVNGGYAMTNIKQSKYITQVENSQLKYLLSFFDN